MQRRIYCNILTKQIINILYYDETFVAENDKVQIMFKTILDVDNFINIIMMRLHFYMIKNVLNLR